MINVYVFLISLLVGLLVSHIATPGKRIIYVHPTPENTADYLFRDKAGSCFAVTHSSVECTDKARSYPAQV